MPQPPLERRTPKLSILLLALLCVLFRRQRHESDTQALIRDVANPGFSPAAALVMQLFREGKLSGKESLLRGRNLMGANWQRVVLPKVDLEGTDLRYADLRDALFHNANLTKCDFRNANLSGADLRAATIVEANFMSADLRRAKLNGAKVSGASLFNARATRAEMKGITLVRADLQEADLHGVHLQGASLRKAHLRDANFAKALLEKADLRGALMINANLVGADLSNAYFNEHTILPDAEFVQFGEDGHALFDKYWTPATDMTRYTDPYHPNFWQPEWVRKYEWVWKNYEED